MRYIHCTRNLLKEINPKIKSKPEYETATGLGHWYANLFLYDRIHCICFMNEKTRFSFFVTHIYKDDIDNFFKLFILYMIQSLEGININEEKIREIIRAEYSMMELVPTNSKSVLASMNDHIFHFFSFFEHKELNSKNLARFNGTVNDIPCGVFKYATPKEILKKILQDEYKI